MGTGELWNGRGRQVIESAVDILFLPIVRRLGIVRSRFRQAEAFVEAGSVI